MASPLLTDSLPRSEKAVRNGCDDAVGDFLGSSQPVKIVSEFGSGKFRYQLYLHAPEVRSTTVLW